MRTTSAVAAAFATLLVAGVAGAAGGIGGKGDLGGGKGGGGPGGGGGPPSGGSGLGGEGYADTGAAGTLRDDGKEKKRWEIAGYFETHRLIRQNDLGGDATNKLFNFIYVYPHYDLTPRDRISFRAGVYQRFTADEGETGLRLDDVLLAYTRFIPLPADVLFRVTGWVTAPTSFASQKEGIVSVPRLSLRADKSFGRFTVKAISYGEYYIAKYRTAEGGNANPLSRLAFFLDGEFRVPAIEKLFLGAEIATDYVWYYGVDSTSGANYGTVGDKQFSSQPVQQAYGGELYARYEFPTLEGVNSDITLSYAQGDPTLGYRSVLSDGARHMYYGFNRHYSEVYAVLSARY